MAHWLRKMGCNCILLGFVPLRHLFWITFPPRYLGALSQKRYQPTQSCKSYKMNAHDRKIMVGIIVVHSLSHNAYQGKVIGQLKMHQHYCRHLTLFMNSSLLTHKFVSYYCVFLAGYKLIVLLETSSCRQ